MQRTTLVMGLLIATASGLAVAQQRPPVTIPAAVQAELKTMIGQWTLEDTVVTNSTSQKIDTGTMECKAAAGGMGVLCVEQDTGTAGPNHHRVDLFGYDADHNAERMSVLEDDGALESFLVALNGNTGTVHVKATQPDGKPVAVTVSTKSVSNDEMRAHTTVEIGGVKAVDSTRTYHRVK
jgi:hypothetical protein